MSDKWKTVICCVFPKRARKSWKTVATDLMAVACGVKSAYLFDKWSSSPEEMVKLLQLVYDEGLTAAKLDLVVVNMDLIIYSCHSFLRNIENFDVKFIDISVSLQKPKLINQSLVKDTVETFSMFKNYTKSLLSKLKSQQSSINLDSTSAWYEVNITDNVNPSSLFGLFLGYPWVYWFDRTKSDDNCLSMQPLRLFQIKGLDISRCCCDKMKNSTDSLDSEGKHHDDGGSHRVDLRGKKDTCHFNSVSYDFDHVLFSFTVPEDILNHDSVFKGSVNDWFQKWKNSTEWEKLFCHVWLEDDVVELQAVSL